MSRSAQSDEPEDPPQLVSRRGAPTCLAFHASSDRMGLPVVLQRQRCFSPLPMLKTSVTVLDRGQSGLGGGIARK